MALYSVYEGDFYDAQQEPPQNNNNFLADLSPQECADVVARKFVATLKNQGGDKINLIALQRKIAQICQDQTNNHHNQEGDGLIISTSQSSLILPIDGNQHLPVIQVLPTNDISAVSRQQSWSLFSKVESKGDQNNPPGHHPLSSTSTSSLPISVVEISPVSSQSDILTLNTMSTWLPYLLAAVIGAFLCIAAVIVAIFVFRRFSSSSSSSSSTSSRGGRAYNRSNDETPVMEVTFHRPDELLQHHSSMTGENLSSTITTTVTTKSGPLITSTAGARPASTSQTRRKFFLPQNLSSICATGASHYNNNSVFNNNNSANLITNNNNNNGGSTSLWVDCADEIVRLLTVEEPPNSQLDEKFLHLNKNFNNNNDSSVALSMMTTSSTMPFSNTGLTATSTYVNSSNYQHLIQKANGQTPIFGTIGTFM